MKTITRKEAIKEGLVRYYTGKPCKRGHKSERYVSGSACVECMNSAKVQDRELREAEQNNNSNTCAKRFLKEFKKRGFPFEMESGGTGPARIKSLVNGVKVIISVTKDGKVYSKLHARNKREWTEFDDIDDIVRSTLIRVESAPTEKQKAYFTHLVGEMKDAGYNIKFKVPRTVVDMSRAINEIKNAKQELVILGHADTSNNAVITSIIKTD